MGVCFALENKYLNCKFILDKFGIKCLDFFTGTFIQ